MKTLLISACLLGLCCRYDGGSKPQPGVEALAKQYRLIPVCPEQLGRSAHAPGSQRAAGRPGGQPRRPGRDGRSTFGARRKPCA